MLVVELTQSERESTTLVLLDDLVGLRDALQRLLAKVLVDIGAVGPLGHRSLLLRTAFGTIVGCNLCTEYLWTPPSMIVQAYTT